MTAAARKALIAGVAIALAALALVAGVTAYRTWTARYTVTTTPDDGLAVARVVQARFAGASDLKVAGLTGVVQSVATDSRLFGMVNSTRVMKAPFAVAYFVDVSRLGPGDVVWDARRRTLTVRAPAVRVGAVNVDESRTYLDRTTGVFVTRDAMAALQRQASANATRVATAEAAKPARLAAAQARARTALAALLGAPLRAAGLGDVRVAVTFPGERQDAERWDTTRTIADVLANRD